jgi:hypothetical protein
VRHDTPAQPIATAAAAGMNVKLIFIARPDRGIKPDNQSDIGRTLPLPAS